ncbi:MAG: CHAT domain-containing protein [Bacteroidia bacterium]
MVPVILLAFADYRTDTDKHLRQLGKEQDGIIKALGPAEKAGMCKVVHIADVTAEKLIEAFNDHAIAVLHFAGHANGFKLMLEESIYGEGMASFLAKQEHLQFVFLNACATEGHASALRQAGILRVITTSRAINDQTACEFAIDFYTHIGAGKGIDHAFAQYNHRHNMKNTDLRGLYWKGMNEAFIEGFPWKLHPEKVEGESWSLSLAADDPLYGLPAIPPRFDLPEEPYRYLHWFERKHAEVFFGRAHQIRQLYEQIDTSPVTLLYGKSGVGKSSLLHAGLFPRLEESHDIVYLRRDPTVGLSAMLKQLFDKKEDIKKAWQDREAESGKSFLLIMDQVEEAYTRPLEGTGPKVELELFVSLLKTIVGNPQDRPNGGILLAFRKEYFPEINAIMKESEIPRQGLFLQPMGKQDVIAAVKGLTHTERLTNHYKLTVEEELPTRIADDLLEDGESAVAPVLQILLTRMWESATKADPHGPVFDSKGYSSLKKEGLLLGDFLDRQLEALEEKSPQWVQSGLVLDVLFRFTTPVGTSARMDWDTWKELYDLLEEDLLMLRQQLVDGYLLIRVGEDSFQLAHDTLAPLIRMQYELSDRPGQRADRLLRGKIRLGEDASELSMHELEIIQAGKSGRRKLSEQEEILVDSAILYWEEDSRIDEAEKDVMKALQLMEHDPTHAFELARYAWESTALPQALRTMHTAHYQDVFTYKEKFLATPVYKELDQAKSYVDYTCFHPDGNSIWATWKNGDLVRYELDGTELYRENPGCGRMYKIAFNKKGDKFLVSCFDNAARLFDISTLAPKLKLTIKGHQAPVKQAIFSHDEDQIITASIDQRIRVWNLKGELLQTLEDHKDRVNDIALGPDGMLISVSNDRYGYLWKKKEDGFARGPICSGSDAKEFEHDENILSIDMHIENGLLMYGLTASWDRTATCWLMMGTPDATNEVVCYNIRDIAVLEGHNDRVHYACFSPDGNHILTSAWDSTIKLWDMQGNCIATLRGHTEGIFSANFSPDGRFIVSGSSDGRLLLWDLECREIQRTKDKKPELAYDPHMTRAISSRSLLEVSFPDGNGFIQYNGREGIIVDNEGNEVSVQAPSGGGLESYADVSPDSQFAVFPNGTRQCRVFDRQGNEQAIFSEPVEEMLVNARFSPDGYHLITTSGTGKSYYWPFLGKKDLF